MSKIKTVQYTVRTTRGIAEEMARYEGGKILSAEDPINRFGGNSSSPDLQAIIEAAITYLFTIETRGGPCTGRWRSFDVEPHAL